MSDVLAIARRDLAAGFALAGIDVSAPADAAAAQEELAEEVLQPKRGIVIVDDQLLSQMDPAVRSQAEESMVPLIVSVNGEMVWRDVEHVSEDDTIARLVRRAVGYQLNIQM